MSKTNNGLVEYAKAQLGLPYWYGTYGKTASKDLYDRKKKQYPEQYTANDYAGQYGKRVHDCCGLVKGYLWSDTPTSQPKYNSEQDISANGLRSRCEEKGNIDKMPDIPGILVFMDGHVGIYIGNDEVIEARGHSYGVVKTKLAERAWKWWGKCPYIDYTEQQEEKARDAETVNISTAQLKNGSSGKSTVALQRLLRAEGYDVGKASTDGKFGSITEKAVKAFQKDNNLAVDGVVGSKTWDMLING